MAKEKYPEIDLGEHRTITSNIMLVTYKDKTYDFHLTTLVACHESY